MKQQLTTIQKSQLILILVQVTSIFVMLIIYHAIAFCLWYNHIRSESVYDMNTNYSQYSEATKSMDNQDAFVKYILSKDSVVISRENKLTCSPGILDSIHANDEQMREIVRQWWYKDGEKLYFLFRTSYSDLGEVRIFYDATQHWKNLIIHLQITLVCILIFGGIQAFIGWKIFEKIFRPLRDIRSSLHRQNLDLPIEIATLPLLANDEIRILFEEIQNSLDRLASQAKEHKQFVSNISHEIKTPLMAIGSRLDLLEKKFDNGQQMSQEIMKGETKYLQTHLNHINQTIESLTLLAHIQSDRHESREKRINLLEMATIILSMYPGRDIKIMGNGSLIADPRPLSIILRNLVDNAVKYSPKTSDIHIHLYNDRLSVTDFGIGIFPEAQQSIFNERYQVDTSVAGLGLGLSISQKIAHAEGWKIIPQSVEEYGTTMTLYFQ